MPQIDGVQVALVAAAEQVLVNSASERADTFRCADEGDRIRPQQGTQIVLHGACADSSRKIGASAAYNPRGDTTGDRTSRSSLFAPAIAEDGPVAQSVRAGDS